MARVIDHEFPSIVRKVSALIVLVLLLCGWKRSGCRKVE